MRQVRIEERRERLATLMEATYQGVPLTGILFDDNVQRAVVKAIEKHRGARRYPEFQDDWWVEVVAKLGSLPAQQANYINKAWQSVFQYAMAEARKVKADEEIPYRGRRGETLR